MDMEVQRPLLLGLMEIDFANELSFHSFPSSLFSILDGH